MIAAIVGHFPPAPGEFSTTDDPMDLIVGCPTCGKCASIRFDERGGGHRLDSREPLSIFGSIICPRGCGAHYYAQNGQIVHC